MWQCDSVTVWQCDEVLLSSGLSANWLRLRWEWTERSLARKRSAGPALTLKLSVTQQTGWEYSSKREGAGLFSRETQPDNSPANYVLYQYQPSSAAVCSVQQQGTRESAGKKSWCSRCCAVCSVLDWRPLEDTISHLTTINKLRKLHSLSSPSFLSQFFTRAPSTR